MAITTGTRSVRIHQRTRNRRSTPYSPQAASWRAVSDPRMALDTTGWPCEASSSPTLRASGSASAVGIPAVTRSRARMEAANGRTTPSSSTSTTATRSTLAAHQSPAEPLAAAVR